MILEVDMGNTRLKWRLREGIRHILSGSVGATEPLDEIELSLRPYKTAISAILVASVVDSALEQQFSRWAIQHYSVHPKFAQSEASCAGVINGYLTPSLLGVDRWLGLLAARQLSSNNYLVLSVGTAATLDLVLESGCHIGGFIVPGVKLMTEALSSGARRINIAPSSFSFDLHPGRSTAEAIAGGVTAVLNGFIQNGIGQLRLLSANNDVDLIFTGGDAVGLLSLYPHARLVPELVLDGLCLATCSENK